MKTPPKDDEPFLCYFDDSHAVLFQGLAEFKEKRHMYEKNGEKAVGWLPVSVQKEAPSFLTGQFKQMIENK